MRLLVFALLVLTAVPADAKPKFPTKYTYYTISGTTAVDVFQSLSRRKPTLKGDGAYSTTTTAYSSQPGRPVTTGGQCRIEDFLFDADFVIKLPKLKTESALKGAAAGNWRKFSSFLKRHEEQHRSIWLGCGETLQRQVTSLRNRDCGEVEREARRLRDNMKKSCQKQHAALDFRDQKALMGHPFIRHALRASGKKIASSN